MQYDFQTLTAVAVAILSLVIWVLVPATIATQKGRNWKIWAGISIVAPVFCIVAATQNDQNEKIWLSLSAFLPLLSLLILAKIGHADSTESELKSTNASSAQKSRRKARVTTPPTPQTSSRHDAIGDGILHPHVAEVTRNKSSNTDVKRILEMQTWPEILEATSMHFVDIIEKNGHHEDFERDACRGMVSKGSPFSKWFGAAYEDQTGEKYSEEESITFDDLLGFASSQDDEFIFNFLMNYLSAMRRDGSKLPGIKKIARNDWKRLVEESLNQTIGALNNL